jgi:hypothetical protein
MVLEGRQKEQVSLSDAHLQVGLWSFIKRCRQLPQPHNFTQKTHRLASQTRADVRGLQSRGTAISNQQSAVSLVTAEQLGIFSDTDQLYVSRVEEPKKKKLHGLSPRANYTDRATAACRRSDCQLLRIEGATWSA